MVKKLYVGNLNFKTTEDEVRSLFAAYGEVQSVNMIMDRDTGRPRGFCFVEMENADAAISELNGKDFGGRALTVNEARAREERPRGGFGGGNRGDRGDRGHGRY
ncbi:MAG: RNA-binding protein [Fibrobacteres bacterium]|nr:RNA-binding protein [Fibrobacterota bacterium]